MEPTLSKINDHSWCPYSSLRKIKLIAPKPQLGLRNLAISSSGYLSYPKREINYYGCRPVSQCQKLVTGLVADLGMELEAEMNAEIGGEMWKGRSWVENCKGQGAVEMLECLEKEAIMGEDLGKEPNDYNRRAYIFDRSSKVFQALKEEEHGSRSK